MKKNGLEQKHSIPQKYEVTIRAYCVVNLLPVIPVALPFLEEGASDFHRTVHLNTTTFINHQFHGRSCAFSSSLYVDWGGDVWQPVIFFLSRFFILFVRSINFPLCQCFPPAGFLSVSVCFQCLFVLAAIWNSSFHKKTFFLFFSSPLSGILPSPVASRKRLFCPERM